MLRFGREDVEYYMSGACPHFAIAAHKLTGWPLAMLIDEGRLYQSFGARKKYPLIAHVFVFTPDNQILDIKGMRPLQQLKAEFHDLVEPVAEELSLRELRLLMGDFKPLCNYSAREVKEAAEIIKKIYPELGD